MQPCEAHMKNKLRLSLVAFAVASTVACGAPSDQPAPAGAAGTPEAPVAGTPGAPATPDAPAAAPGTAPQSAAPVDPKTKEPIITTMPMDVPAGTDLVITLETPVSSETSKADQPIRGTVAKPVVVSGMT